MHRPVVAVPLFAAQVGSRVRFEVLETMREEDLRRRSHAADVGHQPVQVRNCDTVKRKKESNKKGSKKKVCMISMLYSCDISCFVFSS